MTRSLPWVALALCVATSGVLVSGCMASVRGGYVRSLAEDDAREPLREAGQGTLALGIGPWDGDEGVGAGYSVTLEGRGGEDYVQFGLGSEVEGMVAPIVTEVFAPWWFVRLRVQALRLGSIDGRFSFGMFTPGAEAGLMLGFGPDLETSEDFMFAFVAAIGAEYDLRFVGPGSEGMLMFTAGVQTWGEL